MTPPEQELIQNDLPNEMSEGSTSQAPAAQEPTAPPTTSPTAPPAPIYVGGKKFENQDEMMSYFSTLEAERYNRQTPAAPTIQDSQPIEKELATLLYEDPAAYTKAVMEQTRRDFAREQQAQQQQTQAWETFYSKNPDLRDDKDIVSLMYTQNASKLDKMHLDQAMDELAKSSRLRMSKIRQIPQGEGKPLSAGPAVTTGATGGPGTKPQVTQKPMTLAEQMLDFQRKRRKA